MWARQVPAAGVSPTAVRSRCWLWGVKAHPLQKCRKRERHQGNVRRLKSGTHVITHLPYTKFMTGATIIPIPQMKKLRHK